MIGTRNAGYTIIAAMPAGAWSANTHYVVTARNDDDEYVTWRTDGKGAYYWGHYFTNHQRVRQAFQDMIDRAQIFANAEVT